MSNEPKKTDSIFWAALQIHSPQERTAYLNCACDGDEALRRSSPRCWRPIPRPKSSSIARLPPSTCSPLSRVRARPSAYKLLEEIGEGGMGVVYLAEQREPVHRQVALKIIKPGMDTREVVARFEAERQALALMDHPNIAHVLDAGATESGRPYFVMELVYGISLTDYCDQKNLTMRQRLELFVQVCHGVQHAHTKGIIHRDLKPSNVMVALTMACRSPRSSTSGWPRRPAFILRKRRPLPAWAAWSARRFT